MLHISECLPGTFMPNLSEKFAEYFDSLQILYVDTDNSHGRTILNALHEAGLKKTLLISETQDLIDALKNDSQQIDIILLDYKCLGDETPRLIRDIRHSKYACNPFVSIIGITDEEDNELVTTSARSGVDDVLTRPLSINTILQQIKNYTRGRKQYIATADYIGPERRSREDRQKKPEVQPDQNNENEQTIDLRKINVPNLLKMKADNAYSSQEIGKQTREALHSVMSESLRGAVFQISFNSSILCEPVASNLSKKYIVGHLRAVNTNIARAFACIKFLQTRLYDGKISDEMLKNMDALNKFVNIHFSDEMLEKPEAIDHSHYQQLLSLSNKLTNSTFHHEEPQKPTTEIRKSAQKYIKRFYEKYI